MNTVGPSVYGNYIAVVNTMRHAVLIETRKMAAYYINHSNVILDCPRRIKNYINEAKSCYLFVQGTGLQVTMNRFYMNYDSEKIKHLFNYMVRHSA